MNRYRVSDAARSDLDEIWFYIGQDNTDAADRLVRAIVARFSVLASVPEAGRQRAELSAGLRSVSVGNYVIFYRAMKNGIEIVRVLHGARDFPPMFE